MIGPEKLFSKIFGDDGTDISNKYCMEDVQVVYLHLLALYDAKIFFNKTRGSGGSMS
jgi:hypothetical protein